MPVAGRQRGLCPYGKRRRQRGDVHPELVDLTIYVIDVAAGDNIPCKGGAGITKCDLLVISKIDLAPCVGASLTPAR